MFEIEKFESIEIVEGVVVDETAIPNGVLTIEDECGVCRIRQAVTLRLEPYRHEIEEVDEMLWMCDGCYQKSCDAI